VNEHDDEQVGSLGEEAVRLMDALADWARGHEGTAEPHPRVREHLGAESQECRYCPVCRVVHAVRGTSPEVRAHLASAAQSLLQAASALVATKPPEPGDARGVQHIDLDDEQDGEGPEWSGEDWEDER